MGTQIDQEIPELPIPPYKNVDSGAVFVTKAEAFRQALKDTFQPAMNYVIAKINIISNEVSTNTTNAETAANIATAAANYKGNWVAGYNTTGYSVGMSVTFIDGFNYISKINNNLVSPTSKTNTTEWGWIEKYENINGYDEKTTPVDVDLLPLSDSTTSFSLKKLTWANIKNTIINSFYSMISGLSSKTTVGALDEFVINDSGASTKKVTYQNLINTIATSFGGMINNLTSKTTPVDADIFPIGDSAASNASKKLTWANIKATLFNLGISTPNINWKSTLVTINSWSYSTTTITLNVTSHTFIAGDYIEVSGLTSTTNAPNGIYLVTSVTTGTIVFTAYATPTGTTGVSTARVKGFTTLNGKIPISIGNIIETSGVAFGYGAGSGGIVTQLTNKSTAVTLNKPTGRVITNNAALAAGAIAAFTVNNSLVSTNDTIKLSFYNDGVANYTSYNMWELLSTANGSFTIILKNITGLSYSESLHINFTIIKGAVS